MRDVCLRVALDAYERAGVGGLCAEGRWEMAVQAIRTRDLGAVLVAFPEGEERPR